MWSDLHLQRFYTFHLIYRTLRPARTGWRGSRPLPNTPGHDAWPHCFSSAREDLGGSTAPPPIHPSHATVGARILDAWPIPGGSEHIPALTSRWRTGRTADGTVATSPQPVEALGQQTAVPGEEVPLHEEEEHEVAFVEPPREPVKLGPPSRQGPGSRTPAAGVGGWDGGRRSRKGVAGCGRRGPTADWCRSWPLLLAERARHA